MTGDREGRLTPADVQRYRRDGVLFPVPVLSPEEVRHFADQFLATKRAAGPGVTTADIRHPQLFFGWAYQLASRPAVLNAVSCVVGDDILLTRGAVFFKEPRSAVEHPPHQDAYCLGLSREHADRFVTAWIALTPSTAETGCMRVFPGTQYECFTYSRPTTAWEVRNAFIPDPPDPERETSIELTPGSMSLHHANVVHHSGRNRTDQLRIGVVMRYAAPCVLQHMPIKQPALLVRGSDRHGLYPLAEPPAADIPEGLQRMRAFAERARRQAQ